MSVISPRGWCDPAFDAVRDAFAGNFETRGETGAAVCVLVHGAAVADLWDGWADEPARRPWRRDTLVNVFSVGKGLVAAVLARLAGEGKLDPDATVASYWPEFGDAGKEGITVRQLLSHQAGLPAVRSRLPPGAMLDHAVMTSALAAEEPWWEPGTGHGYHVNTFGYLAGELARRSARVSVGTLLREEIAGPVSADAHIGLPPSEHRRVARFTWDRPAPAESEPSGLSGAQLMRHNAYFNPSGLSGAGTVNDPAWRSAEIPSANAHASARGVARVYAALAAGGILDDTRVIDSAALSEAAAEHASGQDLVLDRPSRFGLGFQLTQPERPLGPGPAAFGHFGAGGSLGYCDPDSGLAVGYVTNQMTPGWRSPRTRALIDAVSACL